MDNHKEMVFESYGLGKRLKRMLVVDFRRMFTMRLLYIMLGVCLMTPVLVLVMTTMMEGSVSVDPTTGVETVSEGFDSTWQMLGSLGGESSTMDMSMTAMCNINLVFFFSAILICLFISDDFKSGYVKNLFTVRAKKTDYVISKTIIGFVGSSLMLIAFLIGTIIGGGVAGLPFEPGIAGYSGILMSIVSKIFLMAVFVAIYTLMSVIGKQKTWLSMVLSFGTSMLLFTMIPMLTPLDAGIMNVGLCLAGGALFAIGLGTASNIVLRKTSLV